MVNNHNGLFQLTLPHASQSQTFSPDRFAAEIIQQIKDNFDIILASSARLRALMENSLHSILEEIFPESKFLSKLKKPIFHYSNF